MINFWFIRIFAMMFLLTVLACDNSEPDLQEQNNPLLIKALNGEHRLDAFYFYQKLNYPELGDGVAAGEALTTATGENAKIMDEAPDEELLSRVYDSFRRDIMLEEIYYNLGFRVLDDQVDSFIASRLASRKIHEQAPEQQTLWRNEIRRRIAIQQFLQNKILKDTVVTDEMIHDYFQNHEDEFIQETRYHIRFLQTGTQDQGKAFLKEMRKSKRLFKEVAADYALNESYAITVPMAEASLLAPFRKAISRLKPGQHTRVIPIQSQLAAEPGEQTEIESDDGQVIDETTNYYVLYLESITPEAQIPIEEAYEQIRIKLEKDKRQELLESTIKRFEGRLLEEYRDRLPFKYLPPDQNEEV